MERFLDIVTIVCNGVMIGVEFAVSAFVGPILGKLENSAKTQATRLFAQTLGTVMPFWYGLSLLLLIAEAVVRHNQWGFVLLVTACAIWAVVILLTMLLLAPINNRIAKIEGELFPESLQREHKRWELLHRWRVFALGVAMVCLCVGIGV
jgi:uncharacterized membrane protein